MSRFAVNNTWSRRVTRPVRRPPRVGDPESPAGGATRRRRRRAGAGSPL